MDTQTPSTPSPDLLGNLLGPLAIEGPSENGSPSAPGNIASGLGEDKSADALAIAPVEEHNNTVQVNPPLLLNGRIQVTLVNVCVNMHVVFDNLFWWFETW